MRTLISLALSLCALPAAAQNLQGQWDVESNNKRASATLLIDGEKRATLDVKAQAGTVTLVGYVARANGTEVDIPFTDRTNVYRLHCAVQSSDLLHCYLHFLNGKEARDGFIARRVGPGPSRITLAPR